MTEHYLAAFAFVVTWPVGTVLVVGAVRLYLRAAFR